MLKKINNKKELNEFLNIVGYFHDGVISEMSYISGSTGDEHYIYPSDSKAELKMIIQGCLCGDVEIIFSHIKKAVIVPTPLDYTSDIYLGNIQIINNNFVFVKDVDNIESDIKIRGYNGTYIVSEELSYIIYNI